MRVRLYCACMCICPARIPALYALETWRGLPWQRTIVALLVAVRWLRLINSVSSFETFSSGVLPILSALMPIGPFLLILFFVFGGIVHGYFILGTAGHYPSQFYAHFSRAFRLGFLSDFDMDELEATLEGAKGSQEPMYMLVHGWFYFTSFAFSMLMMNILIGILGHNYEEFAAQSFSLSVSKRARVICSLSAIPWYHGSIWRGLSSKYLWARLVVCAYKAPVN